MAKLMEEYMYEKAASQALDGYRIGTCLCHRPDAWVAEDRLHAPIFQYLSMETSNGNICYMGRSTDAGPTVMCRRWLETVHCPVFKTGNKELTY